jgi:hypothetical protein
MKGTLKQPPLNPSREKNNYTLEIHERLDINRHIPLIFQRTTAIARREHLNAPYICIEASPQCFQRIINSKP